MSTEIDPASTETPPYEEHVGASRQYMRDIILGVNDGLVSIFLLIAGVVGGGLATRQVLLAGIAGAIAGAVSMAAGEYLATKSQDEVFQREIALEREHFKYHWDHEVEELTDMFRDMGVAEEDLPAAVNAFARDEKPMMEIMKALEFQVVDDERRSAFAAMFLSGGLFLLGSLPAIIPFFLTDETGVGLFWAAVLTGVGLFAVGVLKTWITKTSPIKAGLENLVIAAVGGVIAYYAGVLFEAAYSA
ncbi:MAG: VIT1/CCC1 transporter family protein [Acidimicrobiia bacterium]|nr:VIT1/CCC1 transporter family protein [Acidimicrobiia bacterium]NNC76010.1 hypothetical protein [Acidimicrobiia bacterium]